MTFPTVAVRRVAAVVNGGTPTPNETNWGGSVPWATPVDLGRLHGRSITDTDRTLTPLGVLSGSSLVPPESILISTRAPIGYIAAVKVPMAFNQGCKALTPGPRLAPRFALYALLHSAEDLQSLGQGSTFAELSTASLGSVAIPLPETIDVQLQIADYLDVHTAKIDALIGKQERLIQTLAERRQAVISHAVTKGLDPNAPMKDSSVSWLGLVPEHWKVIRVKRTTVLITDGAHISPETENGVYDFVSTRDISAEGIDFEGALKTSASSYDFLVNNGCQPAAGDVLFSKDGTVGRTVVVEEDRSFVVASSLIIVRPAQVLIDSYFLNYMFQSAALQEQVRSFVKGAGLPRLSIANLLKVVGVLPPLTEQKEIVDYLDRETSQIDALSAKAREMIDVLKERRQALISAAVTGKIDVRGLV